METITTQTKNYVKQMWKLKENYFLDLNKYKMEKLFQ